MALHTISFCTGAGGLDLGVRIAGRLCGFTARNVCYVEREAAAVETLVARIADGIMDDAPVWSDIATFDSRCWRGKVHIVTGGYPCFTESALVLTKDGYRPISEIRVGDEVLTHLGRWRRVNATMRREGAPLQRVSAQGSPDITTTPEHPFLAREQYVHGKKRERKHRDPEWTRADEIKGRFVGQVLPPEGSDMGLSEDLWWVVGRYLADGWRSCPPSQKGKGRVTICCNRSEADELAKRLHAADIGGCRTKCRTTVKFHITRRWFYDFLEPFGHGASSKTIPGFCYELPGPYAAKLLDGYLSGDGYRYEGGRRSTTVSKRLAHGIALLAQRAYGVVGSVRLQRVPETTEIEGRVVNQRPQWVVDIPNRNRSAFVDGEYGWKLVRKSEPSGSGTVYNIGVEEDESYVVENSIVHNCQPFSHAGKRGGADDPRHLWPHIIKHVNTLRPLLCFFENVDGHLSLGYREVRRDLEALGYRVEAEIVSAAETGATHRRKRLFIMAYSDGWGCQQFGSSGVLHSQWEALGNNTDRQSSTTVAVAADAGRGTFGVSSNSGEQGQAGGRTQSTSGSGKCCMPLADTTARAGNSQYGQWETLRDQPRVCLPSIFAPGPDDIERWLDVLRHDATVAPALPVLGRRGNAKDVAAESQFRRMANGLAPWLDTLAKHRTERLQMLGNGVVPTSAALAFCVLAKRLGVTEETTWQQNTV